MKKTLLIGSLLASLLAVAPAFAAGGPPPRVPPRGTEGPDIRATQHAPFPPPAPGTEGPAIR